MSEKKDESLKNEAKQNNWTLNIIGLMMGAAVVAVIKSCIG